MSNSDNSANLLPKGQLVLVCTGLSVSWFFFAPGLFSQFFQDGNTLTLSNEIILLLLIGAVVLAIALRRSIETFVYRRRILMFIIILSGSVGYVLLLVASYTAWSFVLISLL